MKKAKIISLVCAIAMLFSVVSVSAATFNLNTFYNGTDDSVAIDWPTQYTDYTGTKVDCMKLTSVAGNYGKAADDKVYKFEGFNDDSKGTHNYLSFKGMDRYVFNLRTQVCLTEQTTKLWYRANINKTLIELFVINADGTVVTTSASQIAAADQNKTLGTLSKNQWHNIDMVTAKDATSVTIYLDGVANVINLEGITVSTVIEFRVAPGPGLNAAGTATGWGNNASDKPFVAYFDNVSSYEVNDMVYEATDYQVAPIASTDESLFTVEGNKITLNADFTVAEFKYALDTTYDVRVYTDATYTTLVSDSASIANGNKVVVENNTFVDNKGTTIKSGALAYYSVGDDAPVEPPVDPDEPDEPDVPADPNVNNTGINTGNDAIKFYSTNGGTLTAGVAGVGGKLASDKVIKITALDGGTKNNYHDFDVAGTNLFEYSVFIPADYDHYLDLYWADQNASIRKTIVRVYKNKVVLYGDPSTTINVTPNTWRNIAIATCAAGEDTFQVYVDGIAYDVKLPAATNGMRYIQMYKSGITGESTIYLDNIRFSSDVTYYAEKDKAPVVSTDAEDLTIEGSAITYASSDTDDTVADLVEKLNVSDTASVRVYTDNSYQTQLKATDLVGNGSVVVVADTYGYATERAFAYYTVTLPGIDIEGINTGTEGLTLVKPVAGSSVTANVAGVGGKATSDKVIAFTAVDSVVGTNFIPFDKANAKDILEFSVLTPEKESLGVYLTYFASDALVSSARATTSNLIWISGSAIDIAKTDIGEEGTGGADEGEGEVTPASEEITPEEPVVETGYTLPVNVNTWHSIALIPPKDGGTTFEVYVDGIKYEVELDVPCYGVDYWGMINPGELSTVYLDNVRASSTMTYVASKDVIPTATTTAQDITIENNVITYVGETSSDKVADLKAKLNVSATSAIRVYADNTYARLLEDTDIVANGNVVVVADTYKYNTERAYAYYNVVSPVEPDYPDTPVDPEPEEPEDPNTPPADSGIVNNTGINTGDKSETVDANTGNASFAANTPGIGGKAASDVVIAFTADDGGRNKNNFDYDLENANLYEFSAFIPSNYDHWFEVMPTYYNASNGRTTAARFVRVHKDKVVLYGVETVTIAITPDAWHNIAIVAPAAGGDTFWVYVDGVAYGLKVADGFTKMAWVQMFKTGIADLTTIYLDNIRVANDVAYHTAKDAIPAVSTEAEDIIIKSSTIEYKSGEASGTVADLKEKLAVSETANIRVYADNTYTTILDDTANVASGNVVVVADTYGYDTERAYAYYTVRPYNGTIFAIEIIDEEAKTAKVTGFNEDNLTEVDDLSSIAIPSEIAGYTIVEIGVAAFAGNVEIQSVSIPDTVTKISRLAFAGSNDSIPGNIKTVKVSKNLKVIEDAAFRYQKSLTAFEFPEGLESIGANAFYASAIQKVSLPDTVTFLGDDAFRRCSLTYLKLSAGVTEYPNQFYAASILLETLVIPATVTLIGDQAITDMTQYPIDPVVYGVIGTYAQEYAAANNFKFESIVGGTIVSEAGIFGDGVKELAGTDYDIRYGYEKFIFRASLSNIGTTDTTALAMLVLYDETGAIVAKSIKDVPVGAGKTVAIDDTTDVSVPVETLKDGYTVKAMVWTKANNEPIFEAIEYEFDADKKELHVLSIANSFGNDAFGYLPAVAQADGVVIKTYNMYIGGAPITLHYQNLSQNLPAYRPIVNDIYGDWGMTMDEALRSDNWDVVALQAGTHGYSNNDMAFIDYETWADDAEGTTTGTPNITTGEMYEFIRDYVEERVPDAKKVMSMSWGPSEKQAKNDLVYGGKFKNEDDPRGAMYDAIEAAYLYGSSIFSEEYGMMVPSAYAIRYALEELGYLEHSGPVSGLEYKNPVAGEVSMFRDETCHLTLPYGRVLVALTWYEYLTGNDVRENPYQMAGISEDVMANLKEAAHWANEQVVPLTGSGN